MARTQPARPVRGGAHTLGLWHPALFKRAAECRLACFSSPFDDTAVDLLEGLDAPAYKIASFENTDVALLRRVARSGRPVIVGTGMANLAEIHQAVATIRAEGNDQMVLLKCSSTYPAEPGDSHVRTIPHLRQAFGVEVGLSDHTLGIGVSIAAVALGATVIEKHMTLDRNDGGVDAAFSLEPHELRALVVETERAHASLGSVRYGASSAEQGSLQFRRSLYVVRDLVAGDVLTRDNMRAIRPGYGLPVTDFERVLGLAVTRDVARGTPLDWSLLRTATDHT